MPVLQIALDLMQLNRAVIIAHEAVDGGADWVEVGTPLIKSEGAEAVRTLRREFPGKKIIADTKTMDVGGVEVEIMAKAGANIITVLGLSEDSTIEEAVMAGRKYGAEVMVDMINVPDKVKRSIEVALKQAQLMSSINLDVIPHYHTLNMMKVALDIKMKTKPMKLSL